MSATKHTPGPWVEKYGTLYGSNGEKVVCSSNGLAFGSVNSWPDAAANARLIAAAPELLEALQAIISDMDSEFGTDYDYNKARAVIAKATGSTS